MVRKNNDDWRLLGCWLNDKNVYAGLQNGNANINHAIHNEFNRLSANIQSFKIEQQSVFGKSHVFDNVRHLWRNNLRHN